MKKTRLFALLMALVMVLSFVLTGCGEEELGVDAAKQDPVKYLDTALQKTEQAMKLNTSEEGEALLQALKEKWTVSLGMEIPGLPTAGSVDATLQHDAQQGLAYAKLSIQIFDPLSAVAGPKTVELELYASKEALCIQTPEAAYGFPMATLRQDLESSELWSALGTSYEEVKAQLEPVLDQLEATLDAKEQSLIQQWQGLVQKAKLIFEELKYTVSQSGTDSVEISCTMSKQQLDRLVGLVIDETQQTLAGLVEDLDEELQELRAQLEQVTGEVTVKAIINNDGLITSVDMAYTYQDEQDKVCISLVADLSDLKNITVTASATENGEAQEETLVLRIQNLDADGKIDRRLSLSEDGEEILLLTLRYDGSAFSLCAKADGEEVVLSGTLTLSATRFELKDVALTYDGITLNVLKQISVSAEADIPPMPQYKDVLKMTEEEWTPLIESLRAMFSMM